MELNVRYSNTDKTRGATFLSHIVFVTKIAELCQIRTKLDENWHLHVDLYME